MRGKKCKELRKAIKTLPQVPTSYEGKANIPLAWGVIENGVVKASTIIYQTKRPGGENYIPVAFKSGQIRMVQNCTRKVYQVAKKQLKHATDPSRF